MDILEREQRLQKRLEQIKKLEDEIRQRESVLKNKESAKKQILLRLSPSLWNQIAAWAEEDFRSINGQMEYLLSNAVKDHYKK